MAKNDESGSAFYKRLKQQGTSDADIERVYRELREKGYGEAAAQRRFEEAVRRLKAQNKQDRRDGDPAERKGTVSQPERQTRAGRDRAPAAKPAQSSGTERPVNHRRAEDWFPKTKAGFRRQVNRWSFQQRLLAVGLRERLEDFLTWFRSDYPDLLNSRLVDILSNRRHYASYNPYEYTLIDTIDALHDAANVLLGTGKEERDQITSALRRQDPFGLEYLLTFADRQNGLRVALTGIKNEREVRGRIEASRLGSVSRELFRLVLRTEELPAGRVSAILATARDIAMAYGGANRVEMDEAVHLFRIAVDNLQRFKREVSPIIARGLGSLLTFDPQDNDERARIFSFLQLRPEDLLTPEAFRTRQQQAREQDLIERRRQELETFERAKVEDLAQQFAGTFAVLKSLFPNSGLDRMDSLTYYLPYFDTRVFVTSLPFPHDTANIEVVSKTDPIQPILVLHRIIDNLLASIDTDTLERTLMRDGYSAALSTVRRRWSSVYSTIFEPYLRSLTTYYHGVFDEDEYSRHFRESTVARSLVEEINRLRNVSISGYGHSLLPPQADVPRLYELVAELSEMIHLLGEDINEELARRTDPVGKRIYRALASNPVVDFATHGAPSGPETKPVTRMLRRYLEARHYSSVSSIPSLAQVFFFEVLQGLVDLYLYLVTDENSFLRACGATVRVAEDEERVAWKEADTSPGHESLESLQNKLRQEMAGDLRDGLTGLWNKNYFLKALPEELQNFSGAGKPYCVVLLDIDHFKWINDTLGHQFGDEVLRRTATTILDGIRTANDRAIRFGGEEILLVLQAPLHPSILTAERLRFAQEGVIETDDFFGDVRKIGAERSEPVGTFSVGVVAGDPDQPLGALVDAADKALYEAKRARNGLCISRRKAESPEVEVVSYEDYVGELRTKEEASNS